MTESMDTPGGSETPEQLKKRLEELEEEKRVEEARKQKALEDKKTEERAREYRELAEAEAERLANLSRQSKGNEVKKDSIKTEPVQERPNARFDSVASAFERAEREREEKKDKEPGAVSFKNPDESGRRKEWFGKKAKEIKEKGRDVFKKAKIPEGVKKGVASVVESGQEGLRMKALAEARMTNPEINQDFKTQQRESRDVKKAEAELKKEIQKLSKPEREKVEEGFHNIGFRVERAKTEWFSSVYGWMSEKFDRRNPISLFARAMRETYIKEADAAQKKAKAGKEARKLTKLSNVAYLAKNIARPVALLANAFGITPLALPRITLLAAMAMGRVTGAAKEARLASEEVLNKTRINDVEAAKEEAWKIYTEAREKTGKGKEEDVSADALKQAYLSRIPKDLQDRLKDPKTANMAGKGILRKHLEFDINRINEYLKKIANNKKLSEKEKERQTDQLLRRWEKRLTDYDRVLTQLGTVDEWAMAFRYTETSSKNVARAMTALSLYSLGDKLWDSLSHAMTGSEVMGHVTEKTPTGSLPKAGVMDKTNFSATGGTATKTNLEKLLSPQKPDTSGIAKPHILAETVPQTPTTPGHGTIELDHNAIIGKGEGIEHALIRQIKGDPEIAKTLGFNGGDAKALNEFAGRAAHKLAIDNGYVDGPGGSEVWIKEPGKVAYQIETDATGKVTVLERAVNDGKLVEEFEQHSGGETFEKDLEKYEYHHGSPVGKTAEEQMTMEELRAKIEAHMASEGTEQIEPLEVRTITPDTEIKIPEELLPHPSTTATEEVVTQAPKEMNVHYGPEGIRPIPTTITDLGNGNVMATMENSGMGFPISVEMLSRQVENFHHAQMASLYPNIEKPSMRELLDRVILNKDAKDIMTIEKDGFGEDRLYSPIANYLKKLQEVTGLKPEGKTLGIFGKAESVGKYMRRAELEAASKGLLDKIKM